MSTAEVIEAKSWVDGMLRLESRGPGDTDNAMRRLATRHRGLEYGSLWSLRYRQPKRIWADVHSAIRRAYTLEWERQLRRLQHGLTLTREAAGADHPAVVAAEAVVRAAEGEG